MYKEIEELEEQMKNGGRKPASQQMDTLFDLPKAASKWDDPADSALYDPTKNREAGSVVGAIDPDYSGFDEFAKKRRPVRDTSTADLIAMGLSTGLGAMFGQTGVAAKVAGEYGLDRFNKAEKRDQSYDDLLNKIELAKAQTMAKGRKGTKIGGGVANADDPTKNRYLGADGFLHTPTRKRSDGTWAQLESDPVYDKPSTKVFSLDTPDGGKVNVVTNGRHQGTSMGSLNAQSKLVPNAKGEMVVINDRTIGDKGLPADFNQTSSKLSKEGHKFHKSVYDKASQDSLLKGLEGSYNDMSAAMTGINKGDIGGALVAVKMSASQLEKGRMTSDQDLKQVSSMNLGISEKMAQILESALEGGKLTDKNRAELESLNAVMESNIQSAYERRRARYNNQLKVGLATEKEYGDHLMVPGLPRFTGKKQEKMLDRTLENTDQWSSTAEEVIPTTVNGKVVKVKYINKNGKRFPVGIVP